MVATVLRLRYRVLGNSLAGSPWQLVGFCFGVLGALWVLGLVVAGTVALALQGDVELSRVIVVLAGALVLLGWVVGPVFVAGLDTTVDAARLAPFPLTQRQVLTALAATGLTGIPGIVTTLAALSSAIVWAAWPIAVVAATPCALLGVITCVVASRLIATVSGGTGRRAQEIVGTLVLVAVIMTGPILTGVLTLVDQAADLGERFAQAGAVLSWTPLGAAWAVAGDVAVGAWATALARFAIAAATAALLWVLWARAVRSAISAPPRRAARSVRAGRLGLFGVMPVGGTGATWARTLTAWLRDPRYLRQLIIVPVLPVLFLFTGGLDGPMFAVSALLVAFILSFVGYTDVSYDGTAFATVWATGIRGRSDRLGRLLGAASVGIPLVLLLAVVTAIASATGDRLPAIMGGALGLLLAGYGVTAVSSALIVTPVAAPGDSPFKTVPGQTFVSGLLVFVVWAACMVVSAPPLALSIAALVTGSGVLGWVSLVVAIGYGLGIVVIGVIVGGRVLDRSGPELLARIKAFPAN